MIVHIAGTTLVDYPGRVASTVFIRGCNLRCPFCHNADLVLPELYPPTITTKNALNFLLKRNGFISGVVFTGGEPLIWDDIADFMLELKKHNLKIKLDTNGTFPDKLKKIIPIIDYVAMDIKTSPSKYKIATGNKADFENIKQSINIIMNSSIKYEFRTTLVPTFVDEKDILEISKIIKGADIFALQTFDPEHTLDQKCSELTTYPKSIYDKFALIAKQYISEVLIR